MIDARDRQCLVSTRELSRFYVQGGRTIEALKPATCAIRPKERIAVMGPSGSGKSTLLHLVAGLDLPTSGAIRWPALGSRDSLRPGKIAVAFQSHSLVPFLSVAENVALPLFLLGTISAAEDLARVQLGRVDLSDCTDKLPEELSGGQAQRVALARAMVCQPALLLADEPTGQLDQATARATIAGLIEWAEAAGCALLVATHDAGVAQSFGEIWHMDHGRLTCPAKDRR